MLAVAGFLGYSCLGMVKFRRPYLKLDHEYLEYKALFGRKIIELKKIDRMGFFTENGVMNFGIWARDQGRLNFWEKSDRLFGRDCTVSIVVSSFRTIDFSKLCQTIKWNIENP